MKKFQFLIKDIEETETHLLHLVGFLLKAMGDKSGETDAINAK